MLQAGFYDVLTVRALEILRCLEGRHLLPTDY
jgi:hypothetical protein